GVLFSMGPYIQPMFGWRYFKIGTRLSLGIELIFEPFWYTGITPLIARFIIPIKKVVTYK
ncbi:hypothetical protein JYT51_01840, partial [Candidatus Amoebophilus asiaticus]|nr:hypothetical protein [Candidatus Amoebophilus asiaticus]